MRWAVIGTGFISNTVIEAIERSNNSTVEILAGRSPERLASLASDHGIVRTTTDLDAAMADPSVEAVYIGLPNHRHKDAALTAARAGKAVLSEKSLTTTMRDARELTDGVREHGTFFAEGLMYLSHPVIARFVDVLLDGRLGTVRSVRASYAADIASVVNPLGRGTIYNLGCYPISLLHLVIQTVFGDDEFATFVTQGVGNLDSHHTVSDAALLARFDNGLLATVQSTDNHGMSYEFAVSGDNGVVRFVTNPWLPSHEENVLSWEPYDAASERIVVVGHHDAFVHQIHMVERSVAEGRTEPERPSPRLADSLEIMTMLTTWEAHCLEHAHDR